MLRTRTANNLANTLSTRFRKYAKALLLLEAVLEVHRRVLQAPHSERFAPLVHWRGSVTEAYSGLEFHPGAGNAHFPGKARFGRCWRSCRRKLCGVHPTTTGGNPARGTVRPLPAGTRCWYSGSAASRR
jgi:hypothetical protein